MGGLPPEGGRSLSGFKISTPCCVHAAQSPGVCGDSEEERWHPCDCATPCGRRDITAGGLTHSGEPLKAEIFSGYHRSQRDSKAEGINM